MSGAPMDGGTHGRRTAGGTGGCHTGYPWRGAGLSHRALRLALALMLKPNATSTLGHAPWQPCFITPSPGSLGGEADGGGAGGLVGLWVVPLSRGEWGALRSKPARQVLLGAQHTEHRFPRPRPHCPGRAPGGALGAGWAAMGLPSDPCAICTVGPVHTLHRPGPPPSARTCQAGAGTGERGVPGGHPRPGPEEGHFVHMDARSSLPTHF